MSLADATVRVILDASRFDRDLQSKVESAARRAGKTFERELTRGASAAGTKYAQDFRSGATTGMAGVGAQMGSQLGGTVRRSATGTGRQTGKDLADQILGGLLSSVGKISDQFGRGLASAGIGNAGSRVGQQLGRAIGNNLTLVNLPATLTSSATSAARTAGRRAGQEFGLSFDVGIGSARLGGGLSTIVAAIGARLLTDLGPIGSLLSPVPSLLFAITAAAGVTAAAFGGLGDALKAVGDNDLDKLEEAMRRLSPQAQAFVREWAAVRPTMHAVRQAMQDAFFGQVQGQITTIANVLSGPLRGGLASAAQSVGVLAAGFTSAFTSARGVSNMNSLLRGTNRLFLQMTPGVEALTRGILDFVGASAPGLNSIGNALSGLLTRIGDFLSRAASSGDALVWVESALASLARLGDTVSDLGDAFQIFLAAARPLLFLIGDITGIVLTLVSAFGALPGPIQTALLGALLFVRSGLPDFLSNVSERAAPVVGTFGAMGEAYRTAAQRAANYNVAASAMGRTLATTGRAVGSFPSLFGRAVDAVDRLSVATGRGLVQAAGAVDRALDRTSTTLQTGLIRTSLAAEAALNTTGQGVIRAGLAVDNALGAMARSANNARDALSGGLIPAALAIDQTVTRAGVAVGRFGAIVEDRVIRAANLASDGISNLGNTLRTEFTTGVNTARTAANNLTTSVQTGMIRATLAANDALATFGNTLRTGALRPLYEARAAYETASTSVQTYALANSALNTTLGTTPSMFSRLRDSLTGLNAVAAGTGAALSTLATGPMTVMRTAMSGIQTGVSSFGRALSGLATVAAGTGAAVTRGLSGAMSGLVATLGGPWGAAIAGAGIALSLLAGSQDRARQAAAEHSAQVSRLADTLDKQTGAVTNATRALVADEAAKSGAISLARDLGVSSEQLVDALTGEAAALDVVQAKLAAQAKPLIEQMSLYQTLGDQVAEYGVSLDDLALAAAGNAEAQDELARVNQEHGGSFNELQSAINGVNDKFGPLIKQIHDTTGAMGEAARANQDAAAAMTPAAIAASRYNDAVLILSSGLSSAEDKAAALKVMLDLLAGGTTNAEIAQGNFTELLGQLDERLKTVTDDINGYGTAMLNANGRINTSTAAGAMLIDTYDQLSNSLSSSVAATIEAGRASGDLDGALLSVAQQTQAARDQFIETATQLGLNADQASRLADSYGLIPSLVASTVTTNGSAEQTQLQVIGVAQQLLNLPPNTPVRVQGLTADAIAALRNVGVTVTQIPGSKDVTVNAQTSSAHNKLQGLLNSLRSLTGGIWNFVVNAVTGNAMGGIFPKNSNGVALFAQGGFAGRRMSATRAEIVPPNTWRVIGDRQKGDEAFIPLVNSARSREILRVANERLGFEVVPRGTVTETRTTTVSAGAIVINAPQSDPYLIARNVINELTREAVV